MNPVILARVTPKLYKAGDVCELLQVQPYVLRSWEKEFPGIGVQGKSPESPRLYRQSDLEHVRRIKQLVFGEGLTVAGARRKLEASAPQVSVVSEAEAAEVLDALGADVRSRLANVRDGLRELQSLLSGAPGSSNGHAARTPPKRSVAASRSKVVTRGAARKVSTVAARKKPQRKKVARYR
jgi:DNA-binding transcriptional MerR regulator